MRMDYLCDLIFIFKMKYILKTPDERWHLDTEGNVTPVAETPPETFASTEAAYKKTTESAAYADLRIHSYPTADVTPGLPQGAICADDEIVKIHRRRQFVEATE